MRMSKVLYGIAALPLLASVAFAQTPNDSKAEAKQPTQLTEQQMDKVTAGWGFVEMDVYNTGITLVQIYQRPINTIGCTGCYLLINNFAISVGSIIGR